MIGNIISRSLFYSLVSLFFFSYTGCSEDKAEGYYKLTKHQIVADSCTGIEEAQTFSPERVTQYFKLQYESFSLPTYIFSHCETDTFKQCETLYYFNFEDVSLLGSQLTIDEDKSCGEKKHRIGAMFIKDL